MKIPRVYEALVRDHLRDLRQMIFLSGPRQVGKTTTARDCAAGGRYFNWDRRTDRLLITAGADAVARELGLSDLRAERPVAVMDEVHKHRGWKSFLKGFFDSHGESCRLIVTGSSRLDLFRRGGDSLLGRYFLYRMHPLSVAELTAAELPESPIRPPAALPVDTFRQLEELGGFPEPLVKGTRRFYNRWCRLRTELLLREDLRDLSRVQEVGQVQVLSDLIVHQAGQLASYSGLAGRVGVSVDTIRRWLTLLEQLYFCFRVYPWHRNLPKALRKQPKVYLWDWSQAPDAGRRREGMVASHLLKAVHLWTDAGLGTYELFFLRDKEQREVDFLVIRDGAPWFLVEVKSSARKGLSPSLEYFRGKTGAPHAFQLAFDLPAVERDCFTEARPLRVPAVTLLSQLA